MRSRAILIFFALMCLIVLSSCGGGDGIPQTAVEIEGIEFTERVPLVYANRFAVDRYSGGYSMIYTADGASYLLVPRGKKVPSRLDEGIRIIEYPIENVYLAATAAMGLFDALDSTAAVRFSSVTRDSWYIESAKNAMDKGDMLYAGKYREPDYELLLSEKCVLSVQSTMIEHTPQVRQKLEELGITVFEDHSSYEAHPLGRSEWIKVYGEMLGKADEAENLFNEQAAYIEQLEKNESTGRTVVFFYINGSGQAVTRRAGDYVSRMIELAGGKNIFADDNENDTSSSTVTMEMEDFYSRAKDADIIIYNSTIGGEVGSVSEITAKNKLIADFKAVREGNVWCTHNNLFQETMKLGAITADLNLVISGRGKVEPPQFLYKLEDGDAFDKE